MVLNMNLLHLVCNAHIDPVWLWEIDEGVAETLSTFRVAADFCDDYEGFIFCHNESMLYRWVEENDPKLFSRIQRLVKEGKWHVIGGMYLQPDCNMPSGESFVRQILKGRGYFVEKFGVKPRTAISFDAFGHTRGLVDILLGAGYDSYILCRPEPDMLPLPGEDFRWVGFSGKSIACHRAYNSYESHRGEVDRKIQGWIDNNPDEEVGLVLWGIGDHGGGPSRIDYELIKKLDKENGKYHLVHSYPEKYFDSLKKDELPEYSGILNPRYTGCYTTMSEIKRAHRDLENSLYMTEKIAAHAAAAGLLPYPAEKITEATEDLLMLEFHDILPGSAIPAVEKYSKNLAGHGLSILKDISIKSFIALCAGQRKAEEGTVPVFVYNPHGYEVDAVCEVEYQLPDQNKNRDLFALPHVYENGREIPSQCEHEASNFNVDWRKKSVFRAKLAPGCVSRYDVKIELVPTKEYESRKRTAKEGEDVVFDNGERRLVISGKTGLVDEYSVGGRKVLGKGSLRQLMMKDDENSWSHKERQFRVIKDEFRLMDKDEAAERSGIISGENPPAVRIIEDGAVRTVVEALFRCGHSEIIRRYIVDKEGTGFTICDKVYWNEIMTMLKLDIPTALSVEKYVGQTAYGSETLLCNGEEMVSQRWNAVTEKDGFGLSVITDRTYGSDCLDGDLRVTCMRSPGYSAGKSDFSVRKPYIMEQDRFSPFIDRGEHDLVFTINAGVNRLDRIERECAVFCEKPKALSFFPTGDGEIPKPFAEIEGDFVTLPVFKRAEDGNGSCARVFNPTGKERKAKIKLPVLGVEKTVTLRPYEVKTFRISGGKAVECSLVEETV